MAEDLSCAVHSQMDADPDRPTSVRPILGDVIFAHFKFESVLRPPALPVDTLVGVSMKISGTFAVGGAAQPSPSVPAEVHVYLDEHDITDAYCQILRKSIDAHELAVKNDYAAGMDKWLELLAQYSDLPVDLPAQGVIRDQLLASAPLSATVAALGSDNEAQFGYVGSLHMFNYLYRDITLPPVSLGDVVDAVNTSNPGTIDAALLSDPRIVVSLGESRFHKPDWARPTPRGGVDVEVLYEFHNPLNDAIDAIKDELEALELDVLMAVERIDQRFWPDDSTTPHGEPVSSIVKHYLNPLETAVATLKQSVDDVTTDVASHDQQVAVLQSKATELKQAIEAL